MLYEVIGEQSGILFGATGTESILQNVKTIISTTAGTVPLDRDFGVDPVDIDMPLEIAKARLANRIITAVREYEPRAEVLEVTFQQDDYSGDLIPSLKVRIVEEGSVL